MAVADLITWEEVKNLLSIEDEDKSVVDFIISSASVQATRIMGRKIKSQTLSEIRHGSGQSYLLLKEYPIKSVTALYIDYSFLFGEETLIPGTDFWIESEMGMIDLKRNLFPQKMYGRTVKIDYQTGFDEIPEDIKQALLETIKWNFNRILFDGIGVRNEKIDGVSTSFEVRIPTNAREIFLGYQRQKA